MKPVFHTLFSATLTFSVLTASLFCRADATVTYTQTPLSNGNYQYDYILANTSQMAGYNAYDLFLTFPSLTNILAVQQPTGWIDLISLGTLPVSTTYYNWTSSDFQYDVQPNQAKNFTLTSSLDTLGAIDYQITISNPLIPSTPLLFSGVATPTQPSNVPEPGAIALVMAIGLSGVLSFKRGKQGACPAV